jgi:uncharacterized membrane protein
MLYAALKVLHVLSIIVWVGGMAFTLFFLRPALAELDLQARVLLMHDILGKFFSTVVVLMVVVLVSGLGMVGLFMQQANDSGGSLHMRWSWMVMTALGLAMMGIFGHVRGVLYRRLQRALAEQAWTTGGAALASIRSWVRANLALGLLIVILVVGDRTF